MRDLQAALEQLGDTDLLRERRGGGSGTEIERDGRRLVNLASNDSLGLANDPRVIAALHEGATRHGAGATASRLVSGNHDVHTRLESAIAHARGTEDALVFSSGYAANVGVLSALCARGDTVFADELVHASLLDGIILSRATLVRYRHQDLADLQQRATDARGSGERFVVTEGIFSMDADISDLGALARVAETIDATLIVDDAHGFGVIGPDGRGSAAASGATVPVQLGTLSKAVGAQGGFVAGDAALIAYVLNHARSFIFSTGLSPALASAAVEAITRLQEDEWRRVALRSHVVQIRAALHHTGLEVLGDPLAPMAPAIVADPGTALALSSNLAEEGVLAPAIRPPAVPTSRLRFSPMATHTPEQIQRACAAIEAMRP